ncbi:DgyrCDS11531 [Dimorphilus gyrociliatus]|uniref:Carbonic anhydrase n=1 Tax=Dimorphilus gyrociliatus TaxID=2664684 RepID=A0A7I8W3L9_9ANNE|nr:DgyrCDS11531 [Dimorphilus gyrociliatus]
MSVLGNLLKGVLKFSKNVQPSLVKRLAELQKQPQTKAVMFSCMDSRVLTSDIMQTEPGDMFIIRNAGNFIPKGEGAESSTEGGALELGCVINKIRHVIVCGHSDCKAMHALYGMRDIINEPKKESPLTSWIQKCGKPTLKKFGELEKSDGRGPISFSEELKPFTAKIDTSFSTVDRLSMVNTLQQISHISAFPIIKKSLEEGHIKIHALWFNTFTGDVLMFSRQKGEFINITEDTYLDLAQDGESY